MCVSSTDKRFSKAGIQLQRSIEVRNGTIFIAQVHTRQATVEEYNPIASIQGNGVIVVLDRLTVVPFLRVSRTAAVDRLYKTRTYLKSSIVVFDGVAGILAP